jgi:hypothetical protein
MRPEVHAALPGTQLEIDALAQLPVRIEDFSAASVYPKRVVRHSPRLRRRVRRQQQIVEAVTVGYRTTVGIVGVRRVCRRTGDRQRIADTVEGVLRDQLVAVTATRWRDPISQTVAGVMRGGRVPGGVGGVDAVATTVEGAPRGSMEVTC